MINFISIKFEDDLKIDEFIPMTITGDELKESPFSRFGLIFVDCKSEKKLKKIYKDTLKRKLYNFR
jgi:hypothetical protein